MRKLFVIGLGAALAGCSLMPEYQRPDLPVAAQWPQTAQPDGARKASATAWRAYFPDQKLQALIAAALEHNRDMKIAAARVEEARALYGITRADRLPTVDAVASEQAARTPGDLSSLGRTAISRRYDAGLSLLSFELDFWGRVKSLNEAALASFLASEEARRALHLSLVSEVANAYFSLLELDERTRLARETVKSREETRTMIARRREVGLSGDLDFLQADGALEGVRAELASLRRQQAAAANALALLVGQQSSGLPVGRTLTDQGIVADLAAELPAEVLLQRPDVLAAEKRLMAANANIGAARAAFLPRISLTAGLGTASSALSGLFGSGSESWTFQPSLRLPLFDAGRSAAGVDLAEARKVIAVAEYEKIIQQAFREVADLLAARTHLAEQLRAQEAAEKSQNERLRLAEARYKAGITSHLEVLDAQREFFSTQQATVQTRRAALVAAAQLYKALGGGS
ncbi:MAG: efflux transporter outer membrane subunit [Sulfurimicrobium sp.]|nr:efflux transporter outer membrane subunit [Sulfurimicrobium sp.]MDP1705162.1 efflux transporter outer membrane subunit [Sulfurimicrobium sp.]MDP2197266.1 efflux transporter outer membrane subunit [Sulfurimicrobium sp.]MDP3686958.1 efflux transporter outer membrane subunit [Sulfurimicrobium sp.]MDZ7654779.1 efflux transporter outer membrane subunit [Sulfurimicrobium sp.]